MTALRFRRRLFQMWGWILLTPGDRKINRICRRLEADFRRVTSLYAYR